MASLIYRLTYSALTASLLLAPQVGRAQDAAPAAGADQTPAASPPAPAAPRPLDDDRYTPPTASPEAAAPPVNGPPPGAAPAAAPMTTSPASPAPVTSAPLAPAAVAPAPVEPAPAEPAPTKSARPTRRHAVQVKLSVQGKVVADPDAAQTVKVEKGDTVNQIADRLKLPREELIKLNKLKKPFALDVGQSLKLPAPKAYVVQSGDTLMGVSRRFGATPAELAKLSGVEVDGRLHVGEKIVLPAGVHDSGPVKTEVAGAEGGETQAAAPAPPPQAAPSPPPAAAAVEPSTPVPYAQAPATPPAAQAPAATETEPSTATPPPPASPAPATPAGPEYKLSVQGEVVDDRQGSREMRVGHGDTVNVIAERLLSDPDDLIKLNRLKKPYELELGEIFKIPTPKAYVAQRGDTLAGVARRFGTTAAVLGEIDDMDETAHLREGQKIGLPAGVHDNGPVRTLAAPHRLYERYQPGEPEPGYGAQPPSRMAPPPYTGPAVEASPTPSDAEITAAGRGRFNWPLAGQLLSGYGPKPGGQRNDGIDLAAPMGAPVMAAGEGDVVYAGNLAEFGDLVLIRDDDGWVTAYAHLSRTEVKIKDHVRRGDEIGQVGQTGGAAQPELHFEIRYAPTPRDKARPIDPTLVLPSR